MVVWGGGAFTFQPPRCNKTNGACIFSSTGLHPPIMSPFFPPPSSPGLKGGRKKKKKKKKIRHSTSFLQTQLAFPGCSSFVCCEFRISQLWCEFLQRPSAAVRKSRSC